MSITREEVFKIAELAKLEFSAAELDVFTGHFQSILEYVEKLKEVDITGVEPTSHLSHAAESVKRGDEVKPSLPVEEALANAPDAAAGHFRVPRVI